MIGGLSKVLSKVTFKEEDKKEKSEKEGEFMKAIFQISFNRLGPIMMDGNLEVTKEQRDKIPFAIFTPFSVYHKAKKYTKEEFNVVTEEKLRKLEMDVDNECSVLVEMDT